MTDLIDDDYREFVADLKRRVAQAHATAARVVNRELILLYWDIGAAIVEKQRISKWGDSVVEQIASDLRAEFTDLRGFSRDNLWRMRRLFEEYSKPDFLAQPVPELKSIGKTTLAQLVPESPALTAQGDQPNLEQAV